MDKTFVEKGFLRIAWNDDEVSNLKVDTSQGQSAWQSFRALCAATARMANRYREETHTLSHRSFEHVQELLKKNIDALVEAEKLNALNRKYNP